MLALLQIVWILHANKVKYLSKDINIHKFIYVGVLYSLK